MVRVSDTTFSLGQPTCLVKRRSSKNYIGILRNKSALEHIFRSDIFFIFTLTRQTLSLLSNLGTDESKGEKDTLVNDTTKDPRDPKESSQNFRDLI